MNGISAFICVVREHASPLYSLENIKERQSPET